MYITNCQNLDSCDLFDVHENQINHSSDYFSSVMKEIEELPNGWVIEKLGNVGQIISGGTPSTAVEEYWNGVVNWISPIDLSGNSSKVIFKGGKSITKLGLSKSSAKLMPKGAILFSSRAPIGYVAIAGSELCTNQGFKSVIPFGCLYNEYLYYFLKSAKRKTEDLASGTTFKEISLTNFAKLEIPIPPLSEQHRIVAKIEELFSSLDKGVDSLRTAQQQLKVYRQAVLKWAFEGKLTNNRLNCDLSDLHDEHDFEDQAKNNHEYQTNHKNQGSDKRELPEGWENMMIKDISYVNPKLPFDKIEDEKEVSFLPMKLVEKIINKIHLTEFRKYSDVKKGFTPMTDDDVIFAKITPCMENGKIAVVHSLKNKIGFGSTEFHVCRCNEGFYNLYLFHFLIQERIRQEAEQNMTGAVGQRRVPKKFLEELLIPIPPSLEEQHHIVSEIETRLSVCDKIEEIITQSLQQAEALRQSILKKAFEGKLVPQDPNDEPASVLLARIEYSRNEKIRVEREKNKLEKESRKSK